MKRSINQETKETSGGFTEIAGISENWVLESYGYKPLAKNGVGNPVLAFHFKNGPLTTKLVEWDIDEAREIANNQKAVAEGKSKISDEEAVNRAINASNGRITQILRCFVSKDEAVIDAESYADLANKVVSLLDKSKNKEEKLRMKTIYNKDGYLEFSTRNGRFINLAKDPIGDMELKQWEKDQIKNNKKSSTPDSEAEVATAGGEERKGEF